MQVFYSWWMVLVQETRFQEQWDQEMYIYTGVLQLVDGPGPGDQVLGVIGLGDVYIYRCSTAGGWSLSRRLGSRSSRTRRCIYMQVFYSWQMVLVQETRFQEQQDQEMYIYTGVLQLVDGPGPGDQVLGVVGLGDVYMYIYRCSTAGGWSWSRRLGSRSSRTRRCIYMQVFYSWWMVLVQETGFQEQQDQKMYNVHIFTNVQIIYK